MALQKLQFKPGLNRDNTNYANEGGWYECDKIRFRSGSPQKIGGWVRYGIFTIIGICRQLFNYISYSSDNFMALGTNEKVYLEAGTNLFDITPLRQTFTTPATDNCFTTTNGSAVVTVNITSHGASDGDWVTFSGVVGPINGIPASEFNAEHKLTFVGASSFTITLTTAATGSGAGGGTAITAAFQISIGPPINQSGYGWGAGSWGRGTWGSGTTTPVIVPQKDWWFDNFDNDLLMNVREGAIYIWEYANGTNTRAVLLSSLAGASDVPAEAMQILISQNDKHLLAFGCTPFGGGAFDPLLIRWANRNDPTDWTPSVTTSAGFLRVSRGSQIIRALPTRQEILVWTNSNLYSLQFTGTTDVFALQELADNISIMSPRSVASANNTTFWMGKDKFYVYSGRVETLPCTLRTYVFQDFNYAQAAQVVCGTNEAYQEVWWFYPSLNSNTNDRYVIYNYLQQIWYYGTIERTAWLDTALRQYPQAIGGNYMYNHEAGTDDDNSPMYAYISSSDIDIVDGDKFMLVNRVIPDIDFTGSTVVNPQAVFTLKPRNFPGSNYINANAPTVTQSVSVPVEQYTEQVFIRARARQVGLKVESSNLGVQWQLGFPRLDGRTDGKR